MATKKTKDTISTNEYETISIEKINRGDTIYLNKDNVPYLVIDVGNPFLLVENLNTHFGSLYHVVTPIYKLK